MGDGPLLEGVRRVHTADDSFDTNPFTNASTAVTTAQGIVTGQMDFIKDDILGDFQFSSLSKLDENLGKLGDFEVDIDWSIKNKTIDLTTDLQLNMDITDIDQSTFGAISPYTVETYPSPDDLPSISSVNIPNFNPSIHGIYVPPPPGPGSFQDPGDAPDSPGFLYPLAPEITLPQAPDLLKTEIPDAPVVVLPTIDLADFPELEEWNINTLIDWAEPAYSPEIWTDVKAQISTFLNGGTGIRPDVEEAIVNRGRDREDRIIRQQVQQAIEEWANRGYTAPPGMLAKHIENIRDEGSLKKLGLQREVVIKAMEEELANLRFAVQQGIAAEQLFIQIHLAVMERAFEVQKLHIEWQVQIYNIMVDAYKARLQENVIRAQVYEVQVRAALAEIEVFKALIDAERAKAEVNKAVVESYTAEIQARETIVNIYEAQVRAVGVQADVFSTEVGAYRAEVEAYAARVGADKLRFDAYESQVRGEVAKANIVESEARAYQAEVEGIGVGVRAEVGALEGAVSAFRAEIEGYEAELRSWAVKNQSELAQIQANVEGHRLHTQRFVAEAGVEVEAERSKGILWEAENRLEIESFRAQIEKSRVIVDKALQEHALLLEAIRASGELASTVSAGALAAMHVGATAAGNGSVTAQGSDGVSFSWRHAESKSCSNINQAELKFETKNDPTLGCTF